MDPTAETKPQERPRPSLLKVIWLPLFLVAIVVVGFALRNSLWKLISSPESVREWVAQSGAAAPLVFLGLQIVQVIIFVLPGETFQIAGGYLFGFWGGLALTLTGITIGSSANFWAARILGKPLLERLFPKEQIERLAAIAQGSRAQVAFFLLFVIPGIPKDILCYAAGLSPMRFPFFLAVSILGRLPGIVGSTLMGSTAAKQNWVLSAILLGGSIVLFVVGYLARDRVQGWIDRLTHRPKR